MLSITEVSRCKIECVESGTVHVSERRSMFLWISSNRVKYPAEDVCDKFRKAWER